VIDAAMFGKPENVASHVRNVSRLESVANVAGE